MPGTGCFALFNPILAPATDTAAADIHDRGKFGPKPRKDNPAAEPAPRCLADCLQKPADCHLSLLLPGDATPEVSGPNPATAYPPSMNPPQLPRR